MNDMDTLQMMVCFGSDFDDDDECEQDELMEIAFTRGWAEAAAMAIRNSGFCFNDPRDAAEVLFSEIASSEDGEQFIDCMMSIVFSDEEYGGSGVSDEELNAYRKGAFDEDSRALGKRGEDAAVRCLMSKGYEIVERNWKSHRGYEADIIAVDPDGVVVFIEVKTRRSTRAGMPEEAVSSSKRRRYESLALEYMSGAGFEDGTPIRFDAICICVRDNNHAMLRHHLGFFDVC